MKADVNIKANVLADVVFSRPENYRRMTGLIEGSVPFPANGKSGVLLTGVYGTGKTMLATMLPRLFEIARADNDQPIWDVHTCKAGMNGVNLLDSLIRQTEFVSFNESGLHYVVLDEVDNLTENAQAMLKAVMNRAHVVYFMTTNHLGNVDLGVIDRSYIFDMNAAADIAWLPLARKVWLTKCNEPPPDDVLLACIKRSNGTARQIIAAVYEHFSNRGFGHAV